MSDGISSGDASVAPSVPSSSRKRERTETNPIPFLSIVTGPGDDGRQQHDQLLETRSDGQRSRRRIDLLAAGNGSEASSSGVETRRKLIVHCKKFSSSFFFPPLFPHVDVFLISSRTRQRARAGCVRGKQTQNAERAPPIFGSRTTESKVEGKRTSV